MQLVPLTKGFHAIVDDEDFILVMAKCWCASIESRNTKVYAVRFENKKKVRLHHFVLGIKADELRAEGLVIHHVDDDGLNCQKENLERISQRENMERCPTWKKLGQKVGDPWL